MKSFEEFVQLWKSETKDIKIKNPDLLFLVVYPDKLEWNFAIEKQTHTTTLMVSGGFTGASTGHDIQFCYRSEVNDFLKKGIMSQMGSFQCFFLNTDSSL